MAKLAVQESVETIFNGIFRKAICEKVFKTIVPANKILTREFDNLNFGKQLSILESDRSDAFRFGSFNLLLIEGSQLCAQELLVKRLWQYPKPRIDKNIKPKIISIGKNFPDNLTENKFYRELSYSILGVNFPASIEFLREAILQQLAEEDFILVLNDVYNKYKNFLDLLMDFWNRLTENLRGEPTKRLFIFVIHKECENSVNQWSTDGFRSEPPLINVCLLDAIEPLKEPVLNAWHAKAGNSFPEQDQFHQLIKEENIRTILKEPYMAKAMAEICNLMNCPEVLSEVLKL